MKKEELNYYDEFIKNTDIAVNMSEILKEYISDFNYEQSDETEKKIHKFENEADDNLHRILNYLVSDFLPPLEREDIVVLANRLDDMIDSIDELVINLDILNIKYLRDDFKDFINLICEMTKMQNEIVHELKKNQKYEYIHSKAIEINNIEETGDKIFERAIKNLFQNETNPIEVLKWNTIYHSAEDCFDAIEMVANSIEEITMKN